MSTPSDGCVHKRVSTPSTGFVYGCMSTPSDRCVHGRVSTQSYGSGYGCQMVVFTNVYLHRLLVLFTDA
jgi:hypothetical protein